MAMADREKGGKSSVNGRVNRSSDIAAIGTYMFLVTVVV